VKYNKKILLLFLFDFDFLRPVGGFLSDSSKDVKSRKDLPFWVIKLNFNIKPLFISQNPKIVGLVFFSTIKNA